MAANALQVFVLLDGQLLTSEVFGEGVYSIGSDPGCDLHLPAAELAPRHAMLAFRGGQVTIRDLGHPLGTVVDGHLVSESPVTSADDINIGAYLLKVRQLAKKSAAPAPRPTGLASPGQPTPTQPTNVVPIASAPAARMSSPSMPTPRPGSMTALAHSAPQSNTPAAVVPLHPQAPERPRPHIDVEELLSELDHTLGTEEPVSTPAAAPPPRAPQPPRPPPAPIPQPQVVVGDLGEDLAVIEGELTPGSAHLAASVPAPVVVPPPRPPPAPPVVAMVQSPVPPEPRALARGGLTPGPTTIPPRYAVEPLQPRERMRVAVSWGHHQVLVRSFAPGESVVAGANEDAAIPLYGFHLTSRTVLAASSNEGWRVFVPAGATALLMDATGRPQQFPATPGGIRLGLNRPVRMSVGALQVELTRHVPPPPGKPSLTRWDWAFLALLVLLAVPAGLFVHFAPDPPKVRPPPDPEQVRQYVQEMFERKPPPKRIEQPRREVQRAPPPKVLAEAKTLQAATEALKPIDQVAKATKEIDNVVNALNKITPLKGATALAALDLPKIPMAGKLAGGTGGGIGDLNTLGPIGPGAAALNGAGKLGSGTAGAGHVRGVPISVPKRPQKIQGAIDRDALARVINDHVNEMRNCYERALLRDPNIGAGKVTLEWTIGTAGFVTDVSTKVSTIKNNDVVTCLLDVVRRLEFPKPEGGVVIVSYPILFNSVGY